MVRKCRKAKGMVEAGCVRAKDGVGVSSTYMQLRSRRIVYATVDKGVSSSSCSASNEYRNNVVVVDDDDGFIDLEEERDGETETSTYRRNCFTSTKRKLFENLRDKESRKSMENLESEIEESSDCCCSGRRSSSATEEKAKSTTEQPTEAEIEEFFAEAEKQLRDKFERKYNFDFEKEKPLEGRYEWVKLSE